MFVSDQPATAAPVDREAVRQGALRDAAPAMDDDELVARLRSVEERRRRLAAEEATLLAEADRRRLYRSDAHASMWGWLRSEHKWSEGECRRRMRVARLCDRFAEVHELLADAALPVAAVEEIGRGYANPRCGDEIEFVIGELAGAAQRFEHDELRRLVRRWELLADSDGAHRDAEAVHDRRNAHVVVSMGEGHLAAQVGALDGAEATEIFERFCDAEFRTDWERAKEVLGDDVCRAALARTDAQRRADALMAIFRTAAGASAGTKQPQPVVNLLVDYATFENHLIELDLLPERYEDPWDDLVPRLADRRCETTTGEPVTPHEVFQAAMAGHVRRIVVNAAGQVIEQSPLQRLFRGPARDAVMLQSSRCTQPGCRIPVGRCQADHLHPSSKGGRTVTTNAGPACPRHNRARYERGFTTRRDADGTWHTYRPDGTEIGG
jgi:Domain of unknown function (DUF222)